ncbi:MAG: hypothetical protein OXU66_05055 [Gammaproteobacteria bacterium]|nr:hypothetical protein [Gammaproteobacteria bacterium]MDD9958291.1 hypothetical protein [Gammaproteobacteria bacterium]
MNRTTKINSAPALALILLTVVLAPASVQGQTNLPPLAERDRALIKASVFSAQLTYSVRGKFWKS